MSDGAHRLWRRIAPDRVLYYRFFNRRKLSLPEGLSAVTDALSELRYDPTRRRGILLASPVEHSKVAVVFIGDTRARIRDLENGFRSRFEA
jgi:hypothetical protein